MAGKLKALQQWCKLRCDGYRDVAITNMTSSWKSGLAFCAIIHRYRPDLIDYDSLSKENTFENSKLAFDVALHHLGIPALLDPEDMVTMTVPDKLCIITYVAQYYNYFHDKPQAGGPGVKSQVKATKRPSVEPSRSSQRLAEKEFSDNKNIINVDEPRPPEAKRSTMDDKCSICHKKIYLLERFYASGKLCHRSCLRDSEKLSTLQRSQPASSHSSQQSNKEKVPESAGKAKTETVYAGTRGVETPGRSFGAATVGRPMENKIPTSVPDVAVTLSQSGNPFVRSSLFSSSGTKSTIATTANVTPMSSQPADGVSRIAGAASRVQVSSEYSPNVRVTGDAVLRPSTVQPSSSYASSVFGNSARDVQQPVGASVSRNSPVPVVVSTRSTFVSTPATTSASVTTGFKNVTSSAASQARTPPSGALPILSAKVSSRPVFPQTLVTSPYALSSPRPGVTQTTAALTTGVWTQSFPQSSESASLSVTAAASGAKPSSSSQMPLIVSNTAVSSNSGSTPGSVTRTFGMTFAVTASQPTSSTSVTQPSSVVSTTRSVPSANATTTSAAVSSIAKTFVPATSASFRPMSFGVVYTSPSTATTSNNNNSSVTSMADTTTTSSKYSSPFVSSISNGSTVRLGRDSTYVVSPNITTNLVTAVTSVGSTGSSSPVLSSRGITGSQGGATRHGEPNTVDTRSVYLGQNSQTTAQGENKLTPKDDKAMVSGIMQSLADARARRLHASTGDTSPVAFMMRVPACVDQNPLQATTSAYIESSEMKVPQTNPPKSTATTVSKLDMYISGGGNYSNAANNGGRSSALSRLMINEPINIELSLNSGRAAMVTPLPGSAGGAKDQPLVTKPQWQLEAERRAAARKGMYIDPEKAPRGRDWPGRTSESVTSPARPPLPSGISSPALVPSYGANVAVDKPAVDVSRTNNVVEVIVAEPPRKITFPATSGQQNSGFWNGTSSGQPPMHLSTNSSYFLPPNRAGLFPTSPRSALLPSSALTPFAKNGVKSADRGESEQRYASVESLESVVSRPGQSRGDYDDETRIRHVQLRTHGDCFGAKYGSAESLDSFGVKAGQKKKTKSKVCFDEEAETKKTQIVPGLVFTLGTNDVELPSFEDTTAEVRHWLQLNQSRIDAGWNVPMRQVNAEKRVAVTQITSMLEQLDEKLRALEREGRLLEEQIRSRNDDAMDDDQDDLMVSWFRLVKQRYELIRDESELIYKRRQQELEDVHGDVEYQLRRLLQKPELLRTPEDKELEEELLGLLLKTVTDRNSIVDSMEVDRIRYIEEDKNIDEMARTAGLTSPVSGSGSRSLKDKRKKKKALSLKETDGAKPKKSLLRMLSSKKKSDSARNEATSIWL